MDRPDLKPFITRPSTSTAVPISPSAASYMTTFTHPNSTITRRWLNTIKTSGITVITYLIHLRRRILFKLTRLQKAFVICILLLVTAFSLYSQLLSVNFGSKQAREGEFPVESPNFKNTDAEKNFQFQEELDAVQQQINYTNRRRMQDDESRRRFATKNVVVSPASGLDEMYQAPRAHHEWKLRFSGPKNQRQRAVVKTFRYAWQAYKDNAWGQDELLPLSRSSHRWFGLGLQILDALDTIVIMGLSDEFNEARKWVDTTLTFDVDGDVNLFECTIRALAGLLSAHNLTNDQIFLTKAVDLGDRLLGAFTAPSKVVPYSDVNLRTRQAHSPQWGPDSSTSEVSTIQIELRELAMLTNDTRFMLAADGISQHLHRQPKTDGLVPIFINPITGRFQANAAITLGARGDSYYEYLLKQYLHLGSSNAQKSAAYLLDDYLDAMDGVRSRLYKHTARTGFGFVGELVRNTFSPKMDHLVCFLPGLLALGVWSNVTTSTQQAEQHMRMAEELMRTCYEMYNSTRSGLAPEIAYFESEDAALPDMRISANDAHYLLRPETVESLFYMWRITGNVTYQQWAWNIYKAIERGCRLDPSVGAGYASVQDVRVDATRLKYRDRMETFFLSETLKYLYLIFDAVDGPLTRALPLDEYVFNSEAHVLPIRHSIAARSFK